MNKHKLYITNLLMIRNFYIPFCDMADLCGKILHWEIQNRNTDRREVEIDTNSWKYKLLSLSLFTYYVQFYHPLPEVGNISRQ